MGIDSELFLEEVSDDLRCSICLEVYDQPIQISTCKHIFCSTCIHKWIEKTSGSDQQPTCPHDRRRISKYCLKQAPKAVKKQISQLKVKCEFRPKGCFACVKISELKQHQNGCEYNPKYSRKSSHFWLKKCSNGTTKLETKTNYVYLTTMPSLYSYSYCTIANRY